MDERQRKVKGRHERNKFNVKQIAGLTAPGIYSDGGGLYVRVRPAGTRSWVFVYAIDGKRREMGLGSLVDVTLAKARERAASAREQVLEGLDPKNSRRQGKVQIGAPDRPTVTFGDFALKLLASIEGGFKNPKHRQQWHSTLTRDAVALSSIAIDAVTTDDVVAVLRPIWLEKQETAKRLQGRIERVLDAAKVQGLRQGENPAAWKGHLSHLLPKQNKAVKHHPALSYTQVAEFLKSLKERPAVSARAVEFLILTAARSGEVRGLRWGEIDFEREVWTVPADRMKAGVQHEVPLSAQALQLLRAAQEDGLHSDDLVFPAPRGGDMSDMSMTQLLRRMGYTGITIHGFRSTFRDWAGEETEFDREVAEMALAHTVGSNVEQAYRRGRALEKRRDLMDAWAAYCLKAPQEGEA